MSKSINRDRFGLPSHVLIAFKAIFKKYPIEQVVLYGSRAKRNYRAGSDIDLCIVAPSLSMVDLFAIENEIDDLLFPWKVDLSLKHLIENPDLLEHIDRVGIKLLPSSFKS